VVIHRFSVWWVQLSPTQGAEVAGQRPVVVLSPDVLNRRVRTVIVAPMTRTLRNWSSRVVVDHKGQVGEVALDQLRTLDQTRLLRPFGMLDAKHHPQISGVLLDLFCL